MNQETQDWGAQAASLLVSAASRNDLYALPKQQVCSSDQGAV